MPFGGDSWRAAGDLGFCDSCWVGIALELLHRHIAIAISCRYIKTEFDILDDRGQAGYDLQAGHSSSVADRIYTFRSGILHSLSQHSVSVFGRISRK